MAHKFWNFHTGSNIADIFTGGDEKNYVWTLGGDDIIDAGAGNDIVFGGAGDDTMRGGAGDDRLVGGRGIDTAHYDGAIADYAVAQLGYRYSVTSLDPDATDAGRDFLLKVEQLYFAADDYTLHIDGTNNAVLAADDTAATDENATLTLDAAALLANDREFDGDTMTITAVSATSTAGATVTLVGDQVVYEPGAIFDALAEGEETTDTFTYTVDDGFGGTDTATVTVTITGKAEEASLINLGQSFEDEATGGKYVAADTDGSVLATDAVVDLVNVDGLATVDSTSASAGGLGYDATWINTRNGSGLSDADYVGVQSYAGTVGAYTDGVQGYELSDTDGMMRLTFDAVDLSSAGAVTISLDYFLQSTGWEESDLFNVYIITDTGVVTLLDTTGQDIDDLDIEGAWAELSVTLGAELNSAQLVVELDSNSSSEAAFIDNIKVRELLSIGQSFEDEATGGKYVAADTDGSVLATDAVVDLVNVDGLATVDSTSASAGGLGYDATWINTRNGSGLSDADYVGVQSYAGTVGAYTDGVQGYELSDADGMMRLTFDAVDLTAIGAVTLSIDAFLQSTGWESDDLARIYVITDTGTIDLLNTEGSDIDDLDIEGVWTTFDVTLGAELNSAQLVVELDSNSSSEAMFIDNISITETDGVADTGSTVAITALDAEKSEGNSGTTAFTFTVTRDGDTSAAASVDYAVSGDADAADFGGTLPTGTVAFAAGETSVTLTIDVSGDTDIEAIEGFTVTLGNPSADMTITTASADGTILDDDTITLISEIQGAGDASGLQGQTVSVEAIVTYVTADGFYLQEEDADADGDAATSEGIYVYTGSAGAKPTVGDKLALTGEVTEFYGTTELTGVSYSVLSTGNTMPTAALIALSATMTLDLETLEGMRVELVSGTTEALTVIENYNFDRYGEIVVSAGIQTQPTQVYDAQTEAADVAALAAANATNRLIIDDGSSVQNPDEFTYIPNTTAGDDGDGYLDAGDDFSDGSPAVRLGAEITGPTTGVLSFSNDEFKMLIDGTLTFDPVTNEGAREETPEDVGGSIQVASINVLNYFTTLSGGTGPDGSLSPRGAATAEDLARQTEKLVATFIESGAEAFAIQEIENNGSGDGSAIDAFVDALNAEAALQGTGAIYAYVDPTGTGDFIGTDAITTGIIYDSTELTLVSSDYLVFEESSAATTYALAAALEAALGTSYVGDYQRSRPSVAASFVDVEGNSVTLVSSHFKSKGDSGLQDLADAAQAHLDAGGTAITQAMLDAFLADGNFDQGDGQGFWNAARTDAAVELQDWITTEYGGSGVTDYILLGDMNAYSKEDPVQVLTESGLNTDLLDAFIGDDAYSYVYDGQQGALDHGIASDEMALQVTGVTEWHINADESDLFGYSSEYTDAAFYTDDVFGSSDHDPLIIGLALGGEGLLVA